MAEGRGCVLQVFSHSAKSNCVLKNQPSVREVFCFKNADKFLTSRKQDVILK